MHVRGYLPHPRWIALAALASAPSWDWWLFPALQAIPTRVLWPVAIVGLAVAMRLATRPTRVQQPPLYVPREWEEEATDRRRDGA